MGTENGAGPAKVRPMTKVTAKSTKSVAANEITVAVGDGNNGSDRWWKQ